MTLQLEPKQPEIQTLSVPTRFIKVVRIVLLVLIVIGLGLIGTQTLWVPKLVNTILEGHAPIVISPTTAIQASTTSMRSYTNSQPPFSIQYPSNFTLDPNYLYGELGPGKSIMGIKFTIPESLTAGTNLASDTYLSIEWVPSDQNPRCVPSFFLPGSAQDQVVSTSDNLYVVASTTGAAAGSTYEETVYSYAGPDMPFCVVERYFIHAGNIANYPAGSVKAFDREALVAQFEEIYKTFKFQYSGQV